jgi:hypothetical protein
MNQVGTHPSKRKIGSNNPSTPHQKGLQNPSVSRIRAPEVATTCTLPLSAAATNLLINPSSFPSSRLHKRQEKRSAITKCSSSAFPERNPKEVKCKIHTGNHRNWVETKTAKELAAREVTWFDSLRELLGHTGNDPGHWNFSPEWWGSQGGGFGRTEGHIVFSKQSKFNGLVQVTAHPASLNGFRSDVSRAYGDETRQEWRVLRFNNVTRQSVARVAIIADGGTDGSSACLDMQQRRWLESNQSLIAHPDCVAQEYLKTFISVFGALVGLQGLFQSSKKMTTSNGATILRRPLHVLCIGLGGGTLPYFIAHHFPQAHVDAVEIDPVVVEAAVQAMGLPVATLTNLNLYIQDAYEYLKCRSGKKSTSTPNNENTDFYDVVCIDAFDGDDTIPAQLCSSEFADMLGTVLDKSHGTVLINVHDTNDVASIGNIYYGSLVLGSNGGSNGTGNEYDAFIGNADRRRRSSNCTKENVRTGCCFTVDTQKQGNLTLACARGLELPMEVKAAKERLRYAGGYVGYESGYRFPAGVRAEREFVRLL